MSDSCDAAMGDPRRIDHAASVFKAYPLMAQAHAKHRDLGVEDDITADTKVL